MKLVFDPFSHFESFVKKTKDGVLLVNARKIPLTANQIVQLGYITFTNMHVFADKYKLWHKSSPMKNMGPSQNVL